MFNLPNLFTAANLLSGVCAVLLAVSGRIDLAPYAVFLGMIFDFFDGFLARKLKVSGELGKQLDSLADMITFGVAPGIIMMVCIYEGFFIQLFADQEFEEIVAFSQEGGFAGWVSAVIRGDQTYYWPFAGLIIPFFSMFRLAKFNLDTRQSESFIGLPTPANTLFLMSFPLVLSAKVISEENIFYYRWIFHPVTLSVIVLVMSLMLIAELPLFSLKFKHFSWNGNAIRYVFLLISLAFIIAFGAWAFALIVFLYLVLSLIENKVLKKKHNEIQS